MAINSQNIQLPNNHLSQDFYIYLMKANNISHAKNITFIDNTTFSLLNISRTIFSMKSINLNDKYVYKKYLNGQQKK